VPWQLKPLKQINKKERKKQFKKTFRAGLPDFS
jgi:hypothetical protein